MPSTLLDPLPPVQYALVQRAFWLASLRTLIPVCDSARVLTPVWPDFQFPTDAVPSIVPCVGEIRKYRLHMAALAMGGRTHIFCLFRSTRSSFSRFLLSLSSMVAMVVRFNTPTSSGARVGFI